MGADKHARISAHSPPSDFIAQLDFAAGEFDDVPVRVLVAPPSFLDSTLLQRQRRRSEAESCFDRWLDKLNILTETIRRQGVEAIIAKLEEEAKNLSNDELVPRARRRRRREVDSEKEKD